MEYEIGRLRAELARRDRGRGKRYTPGLRARIAAAAVDLRRKGQGWRAIGAVLGIPPETVRRYADAKAAGAFLPVEVIETQENDGLVLVSPDGYRIEGLAVASAAELLRRLR
jgi:hypothetical protein